jgi:hypothetical protein
MSTRVEDNECPNQGRHGLLFQEKKVAKGNNKSSVNDGRKGFLQLPNE